jgi:membrane dipeptidase
MNKMTRVTCVFLLAGATACVASDEDDIQLRADELAGRYTIVDTHIDVPYRIFEHWADVTQATGDGQFDYPRAVKGGLNIPFMSIYTPAELGDPAKNHQEAHQLIDMVEAMVTRAPGRFMMVRSVEDVATAVAQGKIGLALGMENGSPLNNDLANVGRFAKRGIRYITLAHSLSNEISDSSFDANRQWNGLSPFGREVVAEMNRAGVMIDISHVSDEAFWQVLEITKVPVIASHSSARHFVPGFERNMSDEMIAAMAKNGGVVQINFGSAFITPEANEYLTRFRAERAAFLVEHNLDTDSDEYRAFIRDFMSKNAVPYASLEQVADHFDHVVKLAGVDHVGIGSDYDGVGDSLPIGLKDVSTYPNLVAELLRRDYSEEDIGKILGGNLLRVWRQVEAHAAAN